MFRKILFAFFILTADYCNAQKEMDLYKIIPNAFATADSGVIKEGVASKVSRPSLTVIYRMKQKQPALPLLFVRAAAIAF